MAQYVSTGKINIPRTLLALAAGLCGAVLIGPSYAWAMDRIPLMILDLLTFFGMVMLLSLCAVMVVRMGVIRNNPVKVTVVLMICLTAWYTNWVYVTQDNFWTSLLNFGKVSGDVVDYAYTHISPSSEFESRTAGVTGNLLVVVYVFEFLLFFFPILVVYSMQKEYFCELCEKFNETSHCYFNHLDEAQVKSGEQSGDFRFIAELTPQKDPPKDAASIGLQAWYVEYSYCPQCKQNGIIDISRGRWRKVRATPISFWAEETVVKRTLVNNAAAPVILAGIPS